MLEKLYDALRAADIPDEKARAAAVEVAEFRDSISKIESTLRLHTWILSLNTAGIVGIIGLLERQRRITKERRNALRELAKR
jgi:hypothetical protein